MKPYERSKSKPTEALRNWLKKLQNYLPSFSKNNSDSKMSTKSKMEKNESFYNQKNLDMIMDTLRKDLVRILKDSNCKKSVTMILYKLNSLDSNIREACRIQDSWIVHPSLGRESLKVQEKYIVRLIEEIMDDVFEAYKTRRRANQISFSDRSLNGVISVLGILKKEVSNTIHLIICTIEGQSKSASLKADPKPFISRYLSPFMTGNTKAFPTGPTTSSSSEEVDTKSLEVPVQIFKEPSLINSKSYPTVLKRNPCPFNSMQEINVKNSEKNDHQFNPKLNHQPNSVARSLNIIPNDDIRGSRPYFRDLPKGSGDVKNSSSSTKDSFLTAIHPSIEDFIDDRPDHASKTVESYYTYDGYFPKKVIPNIMVDDVEDFVHRRTEEFRNEVFKKDSVYSWPSATVVREIKSDNFINKIKDPLTNVDNCEYYSSSDSDQDYESCGIDEFAKACEFFNQVKEKIRFISSSGRRKSRRDGTHNFSCKSAKMSKMKWRNQKTKRDNDSQKYYSVESIPSYIVVRNVTREQSNTSQLPSYHTIALAEDVTVGTETLKPIDSLASLLSFESVLKADENLKMLSPLCSHHKLKNAPCNDTGPDLKGSQFSSFCLMNAGCSDKDLPRVRAGDKLNLLALERSRDRDRCLPRFNSKGYFYWD